MKKKILAMILSLVILLSYLPAGLNVYAANANQQRKIYIHADTHNPSETKLVSEVAKGELFNLYVAIDNPNKGRYDSTPLENAPDIKAAIDKAETDAIENTKKAAEEYADLKNITTEPERTAVINGYIAEHQAKNIEVAKKRAEEIKRHLEPQYDLNGYSLKIYYDGSFFEFVDNPDSKAQGVIDYTIPGTVEQGETDSETAGGIVIDNVPQTVGYYLRYEGNGIDQATGLNYAYVHVYFSGSFLPQETTPDNWYDLCAIPLKAIKNGSSTVYLGTGTDYGVTLYAKHSEAADFEPTFAVTHENGGYHTINVVNQKKPNPPTASPSHLATYSTPQEISLSCSTPECDIYYSKNGSEFTKYTAPFTITSSSEIVAYSQKKNDTTAVSNRATFNYRIVPEKPLLYEDENGSMVLIEDVYNKNEGESFVVYADNKYPYDSNTFQSDVNIYYTYSDIYQEDFAPGGTNPYSEWVQLTKGSGQAINIDKTNTVRLIARIENGGGIETSEVAVYRLGIKPAPVTATPDSATLSAPETIQLNTTTDGADIYYTVNGEDPRTNGIKYNASGILVSDSTEIRAAAIKDGIWSDLSDFRYVFDNASHDSITAIAPPGEYVGSTTVSLISENEGETILYSVDGIRFTPYTDPIIVTDDTIIIAKTPGGSEYTFEYKIIPMPPVFVPESTLFPSTEKVTVYCPETTPQNTIDYTLYYTTDGTDPKTNGIKANEPTDTATITVTDKTIIKAVVKKGEKWSETVEHTYDVFTKRPAPPAVTLPSGEYTKKINGEDIFTQFEKTADEIEIYYTITNGYVPTPDPTPEVNGTKYTPGDKIDLSGRVTINAIAINKNTKKQSEVAVFDYTIIPQTPIASVPAGEIKSTVIPVDSVEGSTLIYTAGAFTNEITDTPKRVYIDLETGNAYDNPECSGTPLGLENSTPNTGNEISLELQSDLDGILSGKVKYDYTVSSSVLSAPYADKLSGTYVETNSDGNNTLLTVSLSQTNPSGSEIYFKLDNGSWTLYTEPIKLKKDTVLYTKASDGTSESEVNSYVYEFIPPAPIFSQLSGEYNAGTIVTIKLPDNLPDDKTYTIMLRSSKDPEGTEDIAVANNTEFVLDESVTYKAYTVTSEKKRSENTIRNYRVIDSSVISGSIYIQEPYRVSSGKTKYISKHLLSKPVYNEGIRLKTTTDGANINYSYTVIKANTPPASSDISVYDDTLPIQVNSSMDSVIIYASLMDRYNTDIPNSDCTFIYKFVDLKIPETNLHRADPTRIEYPASQTYTFEDDYNGDPLYSVYYSTDPSVSEINMDNSQKYTFGTELPFASNLTVKAAYYKACGQHDCPSCAAGKYDKCPNGVFGETGVYKYSVPRRSGGGGGGSTTVVTPKYTIDIFGNEHPTHIGYIKGYPDGSVRPDAGITREEIAAIIYRITNHAYDDPFATTGDVFPDVDSNRWSVTEIEYLADKDVIIGYPDGEYKPSKKLTRAEFAALIVRFTDRKYKSEEIPFEDVNEKHWAYEYISALYSSNLISGYEDNTFRPDNRISRAEAMTVINKILGRNPSEAYVKALGYNPFNDLSADDWHYVIVLEATITHNYELNKNGLEVKWQDIK